MAKIITISFAVPFGYRPGDYAVLYSNAGDGDIDWDNPASEHLPLFPNGAGIHGWGYAPWGYFSWGYAQSRLCEGWGYLPWGHFPWGYGTAVIFARYRAEQCGDYQFAFKLFDELGNPQSGDSGIAQAEVHIPPQPVTGLVKTSYTPYYCTVTGDCVPDVTGNYLLAGQHEGKDYYVRIDGEYYIYWEPNDDRWYIASLMPSSFPAFQRIEVDEFGEFEPEGFNEGSPVFVDAEVSHLVLGVSE
ncbi:MAG: hypothetical protein WCZ89_02315 [Phycisphaerae bacterium]